MKYDFDRIVDRRNTDSAKWADLEEGVLPMFVADMDFASPPEIVEALARRVGQKTFGYAVTPDSYYESIVEWNRMRNRWHIQPDWITYTPGVITALAVAIQAYSRPGDKVIIQTPVYPPFYSVVTNNQRRLSINPLIREGSTYRMDFDDLERKAADSAAKILLLCSPHNPVGRLWSREELEKVGEICLRHHLILVSDEIHSDLIYPDHRFVPAPSISEEIEKISITCASPSKTFNIPGLRHAMAIIPDNDLREKFIQIKDHCFHLDSGSILGYYAAEAGYRRCGLWLDELMAYVKDNHDYVENFLDENLPKLSLINAEATYLAWIDFSGLKIPVEEVDHLLEDAGLKLGNGSEFAKDHALFKRVTLGCPRRFVVSMLERLKSVLDRY